MKRVLKLQDIENNLIKIVKMENTAIKVHVNSETYEIIKDIQQNLRKRENKKTSLAEIMLRLAQQGIESVQNEQGKGQITQNNNNSVQNEEGFAQNSEHFTHESEVKGIVISSKGAKLHNELSLRQEYLNEREAEIRELEVELYDEREKLLTKNRELLKLEENLMIKQYNMKYKAVESEVMKKVDAHIGKVGANPENYTHQADNSDITKELSKLIETHFSEVFEKFMNIKEQLSDIKRETKFENFTKYLDLLLENDNKIMQLIEKGNQKTTLEKLEPLLPAALTAIVSFIMKNRENVNSRELLKEIKAFTGSEIGNNKTSGSEEKNTLNTQVSNK